MDYTMFPHVYIIKVLCSLIRLFLKEFCIEFLNSSYNPLMHYVKDVLVRAKAQQNDESYYLWAVKFFMEFNRGHNFQVGLVR